MLAATLLLASPAIQQTITSTLLVDIHPNGASEPHHFARFRDRMFFMAYRADTGVEPWVTDGTAAGTFALGDLVPGPIGSGPPFSSPFNQFVPVALGEVPSGLLFAAGSASQGRELWLTDGTPSGTQLIADLAPGSLGFNPWEETTCLDGVCYFGAGGFAEPRGLWRSDGTPQGTYPVLPFVGDGFFTIEVFGDGQLVFEARLPGEGEEPWISDGTTAGTQLLADLVPGPQGSAPRFFTRFGEGFLFSATTPETGFEPWYSDGTAAGTVQLPEIVPGPIGSSPQQFFVFDSAVYFSAFDASGDLFPWRWDGDVASPAVRVLAGPGSPSLTQASTWTVTAQRLYFTTEDGENLFFVDAGTTLAQPVSFGSPLTKVAGKLSVLGQSDKILFAAGSLSSGQELWISDGTTVGTYRFADRAPGSATGVFGVLTAAPTRVGSEIVFVGEDAPGNLELHSVPVLPTQSSWADPVLAGCSSASTPELKAVSPAVRGATFELELTELPPGASAQLYLGSSFQWLPLGSGCTTVLSQPLPLTQASANASGVATFALPIQASFPGLALPFFLQGVAVVPGGSLAGLLELSGALEVLVGP